ncbi:MAG: hypothetical protein JWM81_1164 [Candidatus Saccharibacteria bacterium]|nr:hypothetical protein [Candidatus Saccharibacteria bacterium]
MLGLGLPELIVISFILLLMFGATRLPKLAKSLGESAGELQKGFANGIDKKDTSTKNDQQSNN